MDMKSDRALLAAVLSTMRYPLLLVGREGRIEASSHAAADLFDVSPGAIRGRSIDEVTGSHGRLLHDAGEIQKLIVGYESAARQLFDTGVGTC